MRLPYLHSIMVGFNRDMDISGMYAVVEFTFHYGRIQSRRDRAMACRRYQIYIPLWSDSICICSITSLRLSSFTFHYGRIQSVIHINIFVTVLYLHSIMVGFNPCSPCGEPSVRAHLHSIMVGFNHSSSSFRPAPHRHLHSIMVGFNLVPSRP